MATEEASDVPFTTLLRKSTRHIHNVSDTLVQSKFVIGLIDDRVWAEGLLVFYEVFNFLETCIRESIDPNVSKFDNADLMRADYFEKDLELYYGSDWKRSNNPRDRECVRAYLQHLETLKNTEPYTLIAYIYHLYLGLLSGGRILRRKQMLTSLSRFSQCSSVVDFEPNVVNELKHFIKTTTEDIAKQLNEKQRKRILEESVTVFKLNCDLIRSVDSATVFTSKMIRYICYIGIFVMFTILFCSYSITNDDDEKKEL